MSVGTAIGTVCAAILFILAQVGEPYPDKLRGVLIGMALGAYLTGLVTWIINPRPDQEGGGA